MEKINHPLEELEATRNELRKQHVATGILLEEYDKAIDKLKYGK